MRRFASRVPACVGTANKRNVRRSFLYIPNRFGTQEKVAYPRVICAPPQLALAAERIRAGPALPSYLALLHAGFSVPPIAAGAVGSYPTFSPLPVRAAETGPPEVLPIPGRRGASSLAFSFLWHFP